MAHRIGLISDTHGLLRPQALAALQGCDFIVHGGDIGNPAILAQLEGIAPVTAVRGNNDSGPAYRDVPETAHLQVGTIGLYVLHDLKQLDLDPQEAGIRVVVSGHSHKPAVQERGGVLYVNPGSAGPRRFTLPISVAELLVEAEAVSARIIELKL